MHIFPWSAKELENKLLKIDAYSTDCSVDGSNIVIDIDHSIANGYEIKFKSPVDCSEVTRLKITYINKADKSETKLFAFADANGNDIGEVDNLFAKDSIVKVLLDFDTKIAGVDGAAFVQNADTNDYLENKFANIEDSFDDVDTVVAGINNELASINGELTSVNNRLTAINDNIADIENTYVKTVCGLEPDEAGNVNINGVYVGSDTPPANINIWIDPSGDGIKSEEWEFELENGKTEVKTVVILD